MLRYDYYALTPMFPFASLSPTFAPRRPCESDDCTLYVVPCLFLPALRGLSLSIMIYRLRKVFRFEIQ